MAPIKVKLLSRVSPRLTRSRCAAGLPILKLHRLIQKKKKKKSATTTMTITTTTTTTTTTITYPALMDWETTLHTYVYDPKPLFPFAHPMSDNAFWVRHFRGAQQESPPPSPRRPPPSSSSAAVPTASSSSRKRERS